MELKHAARLTTRSTGLFKLSRQAAVAGFADANQYLLMLIAQDQSAKDYAASLAGDKRLERLALQGLESGDAGLMTKEDWTNLQTEFDTRIERRKNAAIDHANGSPRGQDT